MISKSEAGRKGGSATGQSKNRMKHLTKEERSQKMRELVQKRYAKRKQDSNG
jgi:hypothetical protein